MTIDQLPPVVRQRMVRARRDAMRSGVSAVVNELQQIAEHKTVTAEAKCHVRMLSAELAFLDGDQESALMWLTFDPEQLDALTASLRMTLYDNRLLAELMEPGAHDHDAWRRNLDEKASLGAPEDFDSNLVEALRAARSGKHFRALPQLRSYLIHAYWRGDWRLFRDAAQEMSIELLGVGDLVKAAFYAVVARDQEAAVAVAKACTGLSGFSSLRPALLLLTEHGSLRQHARVVCSFIETSADGMPDDLVDHIATYLLRWTGLGRGPVSSVNVSDVAWDALGSVGHRVSASIADEAIAAATTSWLWQDGSGVHRQGVVKACKQLVARASEERIGQFVQDVLALATSERRAHDYEHVLELLWRISRRSSTAKEAILSTMFSKLAAKAPASLLQLGKLLGKELGSAEDLNSFAERFAARIRNQAVVIEAGGKAPAGDGFGVVSFVHEGKQIAAQISAFGPSMHGVLSYASQLSGNAIGQLVDAMLEMISAPWNLVANKAELVFYLGEFAPYIEEQRIDELISVLVPVARGEIVDIAGSEMGDPANPLNAYKFDLGTSVELQGLAIVTLAKLERRRPGSTTAEVEEVIVSGLAHSDPDVRRRSYVAATWLSAMPDAIVTGLLLGARDPVPGAAATALGVFASEKLGARLAASQTDYLIQAIDAASQTDEGVLRKQAAAAASRLHQNEIAPRQMRILRGALDRMSRDPLHSVRAMVKPAEPEQD